jgi:serine/tyrosine/threonine adenylyltransferase
MPLDQSGLRIPFDNTYARLPARFFARVEPTHVAAPRIVRFNHDLAALLGLDPAALDADMLGGNRLPAGAEPIAQAYSGHQFGHFSPILGDGRAILLGEVVGSDGRRYDIQLKGSGPTPFSRRGDGRAGLGPVLREYLIGEAMHALGVPTTRALAAVTTGEPVYRETALPGAVLTRVAASHIRVGTFQFFALQGDAESVRTLADYAIARHYPDLAGNYRGFLDAVIARQAELVAGWLQIGFIHGVMNTDNMAISGETIDYGPCAFMDTYDPATVFSSIDEAGRYAYGRQPRIAAWNLARLAEALLPLLGPNQDAAIESAKQAIASFAPRFESAHLIGLRRKLGLQTEQEGDGELIQDLLRHMHEGGADWTLTFHALADAVEGNDAPGRALFSPGAAWDAWAERWNARLVREPGIPAERAAMMRALNPLYIPRNHLVEAALNAAVQSADYRPFNELLGVITKPHERRPGLERFAQPPRPEERVLATFCGT